METTEARKANVSGLSVALALNSLGATLVLWGMLIALWVVYADAEKQNRCFGLLMIFAPYAVPAALLLGVGSLIPRRRARWLGIAALAAWAVAPLLFAVSRAGILQTLLWMGAGAIPVALMWLLAWGILRLATRRGHGEGKRNASGLSVALALNSLGLTLGLWAILVGMSVGGEDSDMQGFCLLALMMFGVYSIPVALLLAVGSLIPRLRLLWLGIAAVAACAVVPILFAVGHVGILETLLYLGAGVIPVALVWLAVWGMLWLAKRRGPRTRAAITWGLVGLGAAVVLTGAMILTLSLT